ncbi:hypothetical protein BURPS1710b_2769 [Burkholderia pseudomallei 1710b]|uniref:Uncharacterized protein n=1 Tax=Burkholderia pseudomallei (strain 1710b) TaxID=320372 RepID=Q3JQJ9_BURP1|nr:hypothetical protein BURPS1710b_2769 [Burkholderia pseudomallei 1710b]
MRGCRVKNRRRGRNKKGTASRRPLSRSDAFAHSRRAKAGRRRGASSADETKRHRRLQRVVHLELDRVRRHAELRELLLLQAQVRVDHRVREHAAARQELAVLVERFERLVEAGAHGRDLRILFRRQVVQVLVRGLARMDLVLDAVETRHHQRREAQVRVRHRVREARFDAAALRVRHVRNADRRRAVARRVGELHGRFEVRHETLVRVRRRVRDRVQRARVLDDAADVEERRLRQARVAVAREQVLAVLPDRLVHVHARAVVADDGLRHERRRLAVRVRDVMDDVLRPLRPVRALDERRELRADFVLALARHLVVVHFDRNADLLEQQTHFRAHVLELVDRRNREVAALHARTVARVAAFEFLRRRPRRFFRVDLHEAAGHVRVPLHRVENEEFRLRTEVRGVADARALQVGLGALRERARIALVALAVRRLDDIAGQHEGRLFVERVDEGRVRIRHEQHVRRLDALPARDRRAVERVAAFELVLAEGRHRHRHVLLLAARVREAEIDKLDVLVLRELHDVGDGFTHNLFS